VKFHQLPVGATFEYRATRYRKNAPLTAVGEGDGIQRLIPRSAPVAPLDRPAARPPEPVLPDRLPARAVAAALDGLIQACEAVLQDEPALNEARRAQLVGEFRSARDGILARLALRD
jgi:hypothetical protein